MACIEACGCLRANIENTLSENVTEEFDKRDTQNPTFRPKSLTSKRNPKQNKKFGETKQTCDSKFWQKGMKAVLNKSEFAARQLDTGETHYKYVYGCWPVSSCNMS